MPDTKITALTAITSITPATFPLPIVDLLDTTMAGSGTTKKVTVNQILGCGGTATLASATITGDLTVRTNKLAVTSTGVGIGMTPITPISAVVGTTGAVFFRTTDPAAPVSTPYIQAPASTGFSSISPVYSFWYQGCGIGNPALNNVSVITDSTERYKIDITGVATWSNVGGVAGTAMTLNSTGLGVGVSPASDKLLVSTTAGIIAASTTADFNFRNAAGTAIQRLRYTDTDGSLTIGSATGVAYPVNIGGNTTTRAITIDASQNVGIGVTPIERLTVAGTASVGGTGNIGVKFHSGNPVAGNLAWLLSNDSANSNILNLYYYNAGVFSGRAFVVNQSGNFMVRTPSTPPTIPDNEMMVFNLTSNTNLRISVKGTDGTVRTANITLA